MAKRYYILLLIILIAMSYFINFQQVVTIKESHGRTFIDYNDNSYFTTSPTHIMQNKSYIVSTYGFGKHVYKIEPITFNSKKILVFMSDNRPIESDFEKAGYNSLVAAINYEYCKKHNYDFVYYIPYLNSKNDTSLYNCLDPNSKETRHASWSKLLSTQRALKEDYDYVVYIDSDCIFCNDAVSLEDMIMPRIDKSVLFLNDKPFNYDKPCAGFYICKTDSYAEQFIEEWYNFSIPNKNKDHAWEQSALHSILYDTKQPLPAELGIIDSWMFKDAKDQFLRHISNGDGDKRIPTFKEYILKNSIDYTSNCLKINTIYFRTV